ncbi:MAG: NYN domain-containing protein [Chloroflexi bacterium]|nr:NYN domain-containing protein [Chloroflexota bacterium]MCY3583090.1 NYN domain-containing protein [Chloroflexota bacterium]MCY3715564.1 NYN domain-containing protein [Chloroflexota bacterium]MDE2650698.1 NYN domain-containing protein [Chloroflexota bacterium]MXX83322.1 NYN domain-containing protein [Chloroflexota bacterium]
MRAYLLVDVHDLLGYTANNRVDLQELAVAIRANAIMVAGLIESNLLRAVAFANWSAEDSSLPKETLAIFQSAGYETFDIKDSPSAKDCLLAEYFPPGHTPLSWLIMATTGNDLLTMLPKIDFSANSRIRLWGIDEATQDFGPLRDRVVLQRLDSLVGIQKIKNVAVYIDFENISISLNEQGYVVNLDHLINRMVSQAQAHGQLVKTAAYAPWGQRGALPPLVDSGGREVADEAPSRLMKANIDPVFHLPGKQSADIRIARDVLADADYPESGDVIILATGDRDFNDVINTLLQKRKTVVVWGVRGSTGRLLQEHPSLRLDYIDDFTDLRTHQSLSVVETEKDTESFIPSQWSSVIIQYFRLNSASPQKTITVDDLIGQLNDVGDVISWERGQDLVSQALSLGILTVQDAPGAIDMNFQHPIVDKTLLIVNRLARRVANTLSTRGWEYVNYGFLLKGIAMERDLDRPGMNESDQWRSHWIDCLVRERVLQRELVPHRHNPDDLVPVIRLPETRDTVSSSQPEAEAVSVDISAQKWKGVPPHQMYETDSDVARMVARIVISVQQFTSFRNFAWCPLGSLHRRLREYDGGMAFQNAVEYLLVNEMVSVNEYANPRSDYNTKGIELNESNPFVAALLAERDEFVRVLLSMYRNNDGITHEAVALQLNSNWDIGLWLSIMRSENVLNPLPGRSDQFSLFRTHHTVKLVADDDVEDIQQVAG